MTFATWPRRRWLVAAAAAPAVAWGYATSAGAWAGGGSAAWALLLVLASLLAGLVLASYVPARGLRPELGCTPCAALAAATVLGGAVAVGTYPLEPVGPALAAAVLLFGLTQRLTGPATCGSRW